MPETLISYVIISINEFLSASSRGRNVRFQPPDWFPNRSIRPLIQYLNLEPQSQLDL